MLLQLSSSVLLPQLKSALVELWLLLRFSLPLLPMLKSLQLLLLLLILKLLLLLVATELVAEDEAELLSEFSPEYFLYFDRRIKARNSSLSNFPSLSQSHL